MAGCRAATGEVKDDYSILLCQNLWEFSKADKETEKGQRKSLKKFLLGKSGLIWASNGTQTETDNTMIFFF